VGSQRCDRPGWQSPEGGKLDVLNEENVILLLKNCYIIELKGNVVYDYDYLNFIKYKVVSETVDFKNVMNNKCVHLFSFNIYEHNVYIKEFSI
jgi:hypothetical protein